MSRGLHSTSWPVAPQLQRSRIEREAQRGKGAARLQGQDLQMTLFPVLDDARIRGGERHVENLRVATMIRSAGSP